MLGIDVSNGKVVLMGFVDLVVGDILVVDEICFFSYIRTFS